MNPFACEVPAGVIPLTNAIVGCVFILCVTWVLVTWWKL